jgi:hypothetical protein
MANILYNKSFETDAKNIDLIINFFEDYKTHLRKKEFEIFKNNIPKIINFMGSLEQHLIQELCNYEKNDSDNEENYSDVYKNCENEDSISEYDTDTDDEDTNKFRKKLVVKTSAIKNSYELLQSQLPVKFKKLKN